MISFCVCLFIYIYFVFILLLSINGYLSYVGVRPARTKEKSVEKGK